MNSRAFAFLTGVLFVIFAVSQLGRAIDRLGWLADGTTPTELVRVLGCWLWFGLLVVIAFVGFRAAWKSNRS